jgi:hypothetical protein
MSVNGVMAERPCYIQFETRAVEDRAASIEAGRVMYRDVDYAIITPHGGSLINEAVATEWLQNKRILKDPFADKYEAAYDAWKKGQEIPAEGTALKLVPTFTPAEVKSLNSAGILSVEDLAAWPDGRLGALGMGGLRLRDKARAYMSAANDIGKTAERLAALEAGLKDLQQRNDSLTEENKRLAAEIGAAAVSRARKAA